MLVLAGIGIQFIPVSRTNPPVESDIAAPPEVQAILRAACYDCHSNETVWPWYSRVAPVSWLVSSDTAEARGKFNFSTWNRYPAERQAAIKARIIREVGKGDMPPWYYTLKHTGARLDAAQKALLEAWAKR
jgi:hypothetical protein